MTLFLILDQNLMGEETNAMVEITWVWGQALELYRVGF